MNKDLTSSQVVFLLGAGASKNADVPTTFEFVDKFKDYLKERINNDYLDTQKKDNDLIKYSIIEKIIDILQEWKKEQNEKVDIELLLDALNKLENRRNETILQFCMEKDKESIGFLGSEKIEEFDRYSEELINDLKEFIRLKTIVKAEKIDYLKPFRGFIEESKNNDTPLDIISLNYDTCIEQFCNVHKKIYQDGFDLYWNREAFERKGTDIRLYKLHGSIIWYRSGNGAYLKLPVQSENGGIKLIYGERTDNLMLYPMQKWDYAEPLLDLLLRVKNLLESDVNITISNEKNKNLNMLKLLIVVGYSFRDIHIKRIINDAARNNRNIYLIIIDPEAERIYHDRLEYQDEFETIETDLKSRVVCLPYRFEGVFPLLKEYYLKNLKEGLSKWANSQINEDLANTDVNWKECLVPLAKAEFCELVEDVVAKKSIKWDELYTESKIDIFLHMAVNLLSNGKIDDGNNYLNNFKREFYTYYKDSFEPEESSPMFLVDILPHSAQNIRITLRGGKGGEFYDKLKDSLDYSNIRLKIQFIRENDVGRSEIEKIVIKMNLCTKYFDLFINSNKNLFNGNLNQYREIRDNYLNYFQTNLTKIKINDIEEDLDQAKSEIEQLKKSIEKINENTKNEQLIKEIKDHVIRIENKFIIDMMKKLLHDIQEDSSI